MRITASSILLAMMVLVAQAEAANQTAASCSAAAIQAAATEAYNTGGGTVFLPACSGGANGSTWTNGQQFCFHATDPAREMRIVGAGENTTVIQYASGAGPSSTPSSCGPASSGKTYRGATMFEIQGPGWKELGHLTLSGPEDTTGGPEILYLGGHLCTGHSAPMNNFRLHHAKLRKFGNAIYVCQYAYDNRPAVMLFDHISIGDKGNPNAYGIRVHGNNDVNSWEQTNTSGAHFGENQGLFIEDSLFYGTYHPIAGHGSARYTVRANTFRNHSSALEGHGPSYSFGCWSGGGSANPGCKNWSCWQGVQRVVVDNNTFYDAGYSNYARSGSWIIANNRYINQSGYGGPIRIEMENSSIGPSCSAAGGCPYQIGNTNVGPVMDLGQSCGSTGISGCWQSPRDIYVFGNIFEGTIGAPNCSNANPRGCLDIADKGTGCIRENQEYFLRPPAAGDPRVRNYTPFTYPHPLQSGIGKKPSRPVLDNNILLLKN
jgi:hypothetical protein